MVFIISQRNLKINTLTVLFLSVRKGACPHKTGRTLSFIKYSSLLACTDSLTRLSSEVTPHFLLVLLCLKVLEVQELFSKSSCVAVRRRRNTFALKAHLVSATTRIKASLNPASFAFWSCFSAFF